MALVPKDLLILRQFVSRLESMPLDPADESVTYEKRVIIGRTVIGQETPVPCYSLLEAPRPDPAPYLAGNNDIMMDYEWSLLLQGFSADTKTDPTSPAYYMKAQALKQLARIILMNPKDGKPMFPDDYLLPYNGAKLITGLRLGPGVVRPPTAEVSPTAYFFMPLVVKVAMRADNPYVETSD